MNRKLNNKGYMLVEIIVASVIAFSVAYYLLNLVIKFKDINEDVYTNTVFQNDKVLIVKNIKSDIEQYTIINYQLDKNNGIVDFTVKKDVEEKRRLTINKSNKTISYGKWDTTTNKYITNDKSYYSKQLNNTLELGELTIDKSSDNNNVIVKIPVKSIYSDKTYDINIYFKYEIDDINISEVVSLGSYISYTPTNNSYRIMPERTGYSNVQNINPQELNQWRVIKKNDDGTVEIISEHVSSVNIYFKGKTGYKYYIENLNTLAQQYENSIYTSGSRYFGYKNQTPFISSNAKFTYPPLWKCSTGGSCNPQEEYGGGDQEYMNDYNLINTVLRTRVAKDPNGVPKKYWVASRFYEYKGSQEFGWNSRTIITSNNLGKEKLYYYQYNFNEKESYAALRPIVILKSTTKIKSGTGTSADPYILK